MGLSSLGDFVQYLSALMQKTGVVIPFKDERAWHFTLYDLKRDRDALGRPTFFDDLIFDWDGHYLRCRELSEFLHALHWTAVASAANPSYERLMISEETASQWSDEVKKLDSEAQHFLKAALEKAQLEFAVPGV
jgi:hypothetical protein